MNKYIERTATKSIKDLAKQFRVVSVVGPRQSGKTTILRKIFPDKAYVSLEDLRNRDFANEDPIGFLEQFKDGAFLDEIHHAPKILSQIQVKVDQDKKRGQFILSGSNNLLISALGAQSLAGRMAPFTLLPLSLSELFSEKLLKPTQKNLAQIQGGYPEIWEQKLSAKLASSAYIASYVERDVRQLINVGDLSIFRKFLELIASNVGQLLNKQSISNALGISNMTIERWLSVLEASFVIFRITPWNKKTTKRLIKSPKIYFYDTGLLCNLLGIETETILDSHPLKGQIFENLITLEYIKWCYNNNRDPRCNFFRDSNGNEVDLVTLLQAKTLSIEIKSSMTFSTGFLKGIKNFANLETNQHKPIIVTGSNEGQKRSDCDISAWWNLVELLEKRLD